MAAVGAVGDVVGFTAGGGLVAAARLRRALAVIDRHVEDYVAGARLKPDGLKT